MEPGSRLIELCPSSGLATWRGENTHFSEIARHVGLDYRQVTVELAGSDIILDDDATAAVRAAME